jgi:hypothetical protein
MTTQEIMRRELDADFSAEARSITSGPVDEDDDEGGACDVKQDARRDRELGS